jgi:GNAT superfamily N-acetyltransferase
MLPYIIKSATTKDIPVIKQIADATWEPTYRNILSSEQISYMLNAIYDVSSLQRQMLESNHQFLILYIRDIPSGFASFSVKHKDVYKLHKIYLLPSLQGKGLGRPLISEVEKLVRAQGGTILELNVNRQNPAKQFYEKAGFVVCKEEDIPIGPYWMNDYVMQKVL